MNIFHELSELKKTILSRFDKAVKGSDLGSVASLGIIAKKCEELLRESEDLEKKIAEFKKYLGKNLDSINQQTSDLANSSKTKDNYRKISAKQEGQLVRSKWVSDLTTKGIKLVGHGKRYQTSRGKSVGVAFANELPGLDNKWFLGLNDEATDVAVLICQSANKNIYDIVLPVRELRSHWKVLSRSKGQIKFNVCKEEDNFFLLIPGDSPVDVNKYLSNYDPLR